MRADFEKFRKYSLIVPKFWWYVEMLIKKVKIYFNFSFWYGLRALNWQIVNIWKIRNPIIWLVDLSTNIYTVVKVVDYFPVIYGPYFQYIRSIFLVNFNFIDFMKNKIVCHPASKNFAFFYTVCIKKFEKVSKRPKKPVGIDFYRSNTGFRIFFSTSNVLKFRLKFQSRI